MQCFDATRLAYEQPGPSWDSVTGARPYSRCIQATSCARRAERSSPVLRKSLSARAPLPVSASWPKPMPTVFCSCQAAHSQRAHTAPRKLHGAVGVCGVHSGCEASSTMRSSVSYTAFDSVKKRKYPSRVGCHCAPPTPPVSVAGSCTLFGSGKCVPSARDSLQASVPPLAPDPWYASALPQTASPPQSLRSEHTSPTQAHTAKTAVPGPCLTATIHLRNSTS